MTIEEIYKLPVDSLGRRRMPSGNSVTLGDGVKLGDDVKLGNSVKLGDYVTLGNSVTLGNGVKLGNSVTLWNSVKLGDLVKLGDYVTLGEDGLDYLRSPLQIQGSQHLLYVIGPTLIGIGCIRQTGPWWLKHYKSTGKTENYSSQQIAEYREWIDIAIAWQSKLGAEK